MGIRVNKAMTILNIGTETVVDYLKSVPGLEPTKEMGPNTNLSDAQFEALQKRFSGDILTKSKAKTLFQRTKKNTRSNKSHNLFNGKEVTVFEKRLPLKDLKYENHRLFFQMGTEAFVLLDGHAPAYVKSDRYLAKENDLIIVIRINRSKHSFTFEDEGLLSRLNLVSFQVEKEMKDKQNKEREEVRKKKKQQNSIEKKEQKKTEKSPKTQKQIRIQFNTLKFGVGLASITHKKIRYVYRDYHIRDFDQVLQGVYGRVSKARKNAIKASLVKVLIDQETKSFSFVDFDVCRYVNNLKESFLPDKKFFDNRSDTSSKATRVQKSTNALSTMVLSAGNIHFYNGYFLIFRTTKGEIDNSVTSYRINDPDSHEILNLVHKYFEQRFDQMRIMVKYDEIKIFEPAKSELYQLNKYVRTLKRNLDVKGEWWEEVQNARKRTFGQCLDESTDSVKKRVVKAKNEYLYNLASLQNDRKLIRVYEINHGNEEDAFIFTISMPNDRYAVIFENASNDASTTTWVFEVKNENYEACVNLVFDYFTDYTISSKRSTLRAKTINPPEKFKAENYTFIDHNDLRQWLKKLNKVLERTSAPSDLAFVPGLNIPRSSKIRSGHGDAITTNNLHNELMRKLYDRLCSESGKDNVGTEIHVGAKRIDAVVKGSDFYDLYEVKTALNPFDCVTEALGQLCQYAYLFCRDKIGKMVIVGASEPTKEVEQYLATLRKNHSLSVYYVKV